MNAIIIYIMEVTILILIDGFLQLHYWDDTHQVCTSHNPYFNRWFSAIDEKIKNDTNIDVVTILILIDGFLQCTLLKHPKSPMRVTILILIDGFLQFEQQKNKEDKKSCHNPYFNRWFSAIDRN